MSAAAVAEGILPSLGIGGLFYFVMRGILRGDRNEREAIARLEHEEAERAARLTAEHGEPSSAE